MIILEFLLKLILSSGILFGYYWLFLRDQKFHRFNRYYLLGVLLITPVISLLKIPVSFQSQSGADTVLRSLDELKTISAGTPAESPGNYPIILFIIYSCISLLILVFIVRGLWYIQSLRKKYRSNTIAEIRLYQTTEPGTPFSFFSSVFWQKELSLESTEGQRIFRHELYHVKQHHSADILFAELLLSLLWINPIFFLVRKELKAIHEFLADQYAIGNEDGVEYASLLIQRILDSRQISLTHPFFQTHIKRRIAMITKPSTPYSYWSRLMALPVGIILIAGTVLYAGAARTQSVSSTQTEPVLQSVQETEKTTSKVKDTIPRESREKIERLRSELKEKRKELRQIQEKQQQEIQEKEKELATTLEELSKNKQLSSEDLVELKKQQETHELTQLKLKKEQEQLIEGKIRQDQSQIINLKLQKKVEEKQQIEEDRINLKLKEKAATEAVIDRKKQAEMEEKMAIEQQHSQEKQKEIQLQLKYVPEDKDHQKKVIEKKKAVEKKVKEKKRDEE